MAPAPRPASAALCLATALLVTACGDGGGQAAPAVTTVTVTAEASQSATEPPPPTPTPTPSLVTVTSARSTPAPTAGAGPRLRIDHRVQADTRGRPLQLPAVTVTALDGDPATTRAARSLQQALADQVGQVVEGWESAGPTSGAPGGSVTTERVEVPVNEAELAVVAWRAEVYTGGAHGLSVLRSVTVDVAHGELVTDAGLLAQLQQAGGPGWVFERELRRAVRQQLPHVPADEVERLGRDELHLYPTRAGLHVTGDRCVLACAFPALEVTIPWDRLVGKGDDIRALPDSWGL